MDQTWENFISSLYIFGFVFSINSFGCGFHMVLDIFFLFIVIVSPKHDAPGQENGF
jgi:hypothetical protein